MATRRKSARHAAVQVLEDAGKPLTGAEICRRVLRTDGVELHGKTPLATIYAILATENAKPDGLFVRVARGVYRLR